MALIRASFNFTRDMETFKAKVIDAVQELLREKITSLEQAMRDLQDSALQEGKSTAGDKHETGRAMIHIEQEKIAAQIHQQKEILYQFQRIDFHSVSTSVRSGSMIETNLGWFLIAGAIGKVSVDDKTIMVISPESPLGNKILNRQEGDGFEVGKTNYHILNIR